MAITGDPIHSHVRSKQFQRPYAKRRQDKRPMVGQRQDTRIPLQQYTHRRHQRQRHHCQTDDTAVQGSDSIRRRQPLHTDIQEQESLYAILRQITMENKQQKQHDLDLRYLRMATIWAENSYCQRRKVGALIVKDKMIISDGYNGTPAGFENICENEDGFTKPYVLHAEANAITKIACSNNNSAGATMYVTTSPCIECAKLIVQAGIKRVVYSNKYRLTDGIDLLTRAGIEVVYINMCENENSSK